MVVLVGLLLVVMVGGYIGYPLFVDKLMQRHSWTREQLQSIEAEIEREILALRKYPDKPKP
jgi:uncharacterized membrane protein YqhA